MLKRKRASWWRTGRTAAIGAAAVVMIAASTACSGPAGGASSGVALVAMTSEPGVMNPMFSTEDGADISHAFVVEPLYLLLEDGSFDPYLADEIPTVENGGVSEDGLSIVFSVRDGITWSDGEPFTAEDLAFTIEVAQNPAGAAMAEPEYDSIEAFEVVDDTTLEVTFAQPEPGYLMLFRDVLPAHRFDSSEVALEDPLVRLPLGTGPFVYEEWLPGDEIRLAKNEQYWRDPSLPKLAGVTLRIVPDKQNAVAGFINGEYDTLDFISSSDFTQLERAQADGAPISLEIDSELPGYVEYLWLNHSDNGDPNVGHPVLSDPAVREAIDLGIDRQAIVDDLLGGHAVLTGAFLASGFGAVERPATPYDPERAAAVLDAAGWALGADGVREKDGVRASLRFQTIAGDQDRVLYQQVVQQNLADLGIELAIENVPAGTLFDGQEAGGLLATGDYDIVMSRDGRYADPGLWVYTFTSLSIPSEENGGNGFTYSHWRNAAYDELGYVAATTLDFDERKAVLAEIDDLFVSERVAIPLFSPTLGLAWNESLTGVETGFWDGIWAARGTAEWELAG